MSMVVIYIYIYLCTYIQHISVQASGAASSPREALCSRTAASARRALRMSVSMVVIYIYTSACTYIQTHIRLGQRRRLFSARGALQQNCCVGAPRAEDVRVDGVLDDEAVDLDRACLAVAPHAPNLRDSRVVSRVKGVTRG